MRNSGQRGIVASPQRLPLLAGAPVRHCLLGPVGVGERAQGLGQLVEDLRDPHAAYALERETKLLDSLVESGPEFRRPGSVEVRPELGRRLQAGGGVGQRPPCETLAVGEAERARLLLSGIGKLQETLVVAGGGRRGPVGLERVGPASLRRIQADERVVGSHRRNPMSTRSRRPIAFTLPTAGSEEESETEGAAASIRSRSERRTRYMRMLAAAPSVSDSSSEP